MLGKGHTVSQRSYLPSAVWLLLKGLLFSLFVSFIFIVIFAAALYFTPFPEWIMPYIVGVVVLVSIVSGSMYVGRRVEAKGWLNGGISGLLYIIFVLIFGYFMNLETAPASILLGRLFLGFSFGCIGGILGINS